MRLREVQRREFSTRPRKSELCRDVGWTSDDGSDSLPTETVDDDRRTTSDQHQLLVVRKFQVLDGVVRRKRRVLDVQCCLELDLPHIN